MDNQVLQAIRQNNVKISHLAREWSVNRSAIYQSIDGNGSRRIRLKISKLVNIKPSKLWPENDRKSLVVDDAMFDLNEDIINEL